MWIGTTNPGKTREFATMLAPLGIPLEPISGDVPETGITFGENSRIKALAYADLAQQQGGGTPLVLCEDSGLVVPALKGLPGPWSARFIDLDINTLEVCPSSLTDREEIDARNNERVLQLLDSSDLPLRGAYFVSHISVARPGEVLWEIEEQAHGWIATAPRGSNGFGYDPIFIGQDTYDKTYAELDPVRKNMRSHRKRAMDQLYYWLSQNLTLVTT